MFNKHKTKKIDSLKVRFLDAEELDGEMEIWLDGHGTLRLKDILEALLNHLNVKSIKTKLEVE